MTYGTLILLAALAIFALFVWNKKDVDIGSSSDEDGAW